MKSIKGGKLLGGLTRKNPKGDSGVRASSYGESMNGESTRDSVGRGHTLGGRTA